MDVRHRVMTWLFEVSAGPYARWMKRGTPWGLSAAQLARRAEGTLGHALGCYLQRKGFELLPRLESHDVVHLVTGMGTDVPDEVALQFLLLGNGKRSLYLFGVVSLGAVLLPEEGGRFLRAFLRGQRLPRFFDRAWRDQLDEPLRAALLEGHAEAPDRALAAARRDAERAAEVGEGVGDGRQAYPAARQRVGVVAGGETIVQQGSYEVVVGGVG